jgi:predicted bacteriocin transport accessory protein
MIKDKKSAIIYIGRPNCSYCKKFNDKLSKYLIESNKTILYYNTIYDRENNIDAMKSTLNKLNVQTVPSIIKLNNGDTEKIITGDDIDDIFEQTKVLLNN